MKYKTEDAVDRSGRDHHQSVSRQTVGQLERTISQKMQALYKKHLGHQPTKVTCQLFDSKLAIVLENSVTQPEKLLVDNGKTELAVKVHNNLNQAIEPQVKSLIESILDVKVLDLLSDAAIDTARTGVIAILSNTPTVRNPEAIPKVKR